jgi:hypothetical protein
VVQTFLDLFDEPRYLEVGVARGDTFHALSASQKSAVDPHFDFNVSAARRDNPQASYHEVSSDDYFGSAHAAREFDVIYLDGLHTLEQTLRDFTSALELLAPGGVIVIDDVLPNSHFAALPDVDEFLWHRHANFVLDDSWMGDVYRLVFMIDSFFQQVSYRTTADNHGQLVVWKAARRSVTERKVEDIARLGYEAVLKEADVLRRAPLHLIHAEVVAWREQAQPPS